MFAGAEGPRRVKNVMVGAEPLDPDKTYSLAGTNHTLVDLGGGFSMFKGCKVLQDCVKLDNQLLIDFITQTLGGEVGEGYEDPYGQGRIQIFDVAPEE